MKSPLFDLTPFTLVPDLVHNFGKDWTVVEHTESVDGAKTIIFAANRIDDFCDSETDENCDETCKVRNISLEIAHLTQCCSNLKNTSSPNEQVHGLDDCKLEL